MKTLKKFEQVNTAHFLLNKRLQVHFENEKAQYASNSLLEHKCPLCSGMKPFRSFILLKDHMRKEHNLFYCDLCTDSLKVSGRI